MELSDVGKRILAGMAAGDGVIETARSLSVTVEKAVVARRAVIAAVGAGSAFEAGLVFLAERALQAGISPMAKPKAANDASAVPASPAGLERRDQRVP